MLARDQVLGLLDRARRTYRLTALLAQCPGEVIGNEKLVFDDENPRSLQRRCRSHGSVR